MKKEVDYNNQSADPTGHLPAPTLPDRSHGGVSHDSVSILQSDSRNKESNQSGDLTKMKVQLHVARKETKHWRR